MSRYRFIAAEQAAFPVRRLCQVLGVVPSRYYAWQQSQRRATGAAPPTWETALVALFQRHKRRYGTRRLRVALREKGHRVGRQALRTALARRGLRALQPKAYTPRNTNSTHGLRCAPNCLLDQPTPTQGNCVWVLDITYLPLADGRWTYLAAFQDMASKLVVGWHVLDTMPEELITTALQRAFWAHPPTPPLPWSFIPTAVVPGRAASTASMPTAPCCTGTGPCARRTGGANATTTSYRVRPKPKAVGRALKPRDSNAENSLLLRT